MFVQWWLMTRASDPKTDPPAEPLPVIGWREYVDLPEWGGSRIKAKVDTGARTSAIDVANIEELSDDRVRFDVIFDRSQEHRRTTVETDIVRRTRVKSSFGHAHDRLYVRTMIRIGDHELPAELGLVCRKTMLCRMLLGRKFIEGQFVVDAGHRYRLSRRQRTKAGRRSTASKKADP
jgi:hypothetical protein